MPSVRALARDLGLSPTTVAAAYRDLRQRNVLVTHDRSRTVVAHRPPLAVRLAPQIPDGVVDLASGNPDPELLADLERPLGGLTAEHRLYGSEVVDVTLAALAREAFARDGVPTDHLAVVGGGLDGIERVLEVHCRVGDHVAIEDPGYAGTLDLVRTLGLHPVPVPVDDEGMDAGALEAALVGGVTAVIHVPRAQNPFGSMLSRARADGLRDRLKAHPDVLVVEDDHAAAISGSAHHQLVDGQHRWASIRSLSKSLGPDLRVAVLIGDEDTVVRVMGRQRLGTGWVSHLLQRLSAAAWSTADGDGTLARATARYASRREALLVALAERDLVGHGASGLNVWIPVAEEVPVVQGMMNRGWAVQPGEPHRIDTDPAIRITTAALPEEHVDGLVDDLVEVLGHRLGTRRG